MSRLTNALCALGELVTGKPITGSTVTEVIENIVAEYPSAAEHEPAGTGDNE